MKSQTNLTQINMSTTEKINAVLEAINQDIAGHKEEAKRAMLAMEQMSVTEENYKEANLNFGLNLFVAGYLTHIKDTITGTDIKTTENFIRFHAHYQQTKGNLTDDSNIPFGRAEVTTLLNGYIAKFFDA